MAASFLSSPPIIHFRVAACCLGRTALPRRRASRATCRERRCGRLRVCDFGHDCSMRRRQVSGRGRCPPRQSTPCSGCFFKPAVDTHLFRISVTCCAHAHVASCRTSPSSARSLPCGGHAARRREHQTLVARVCAGSRSGPKRQASRTLRGRLAITV